MKKVILFVLFAILGGVVSFIYAALLGYIWRAHVPSNRR